MLIIHDLMLLLLDDESGKQRPVSTLTELLGGALLVELTAAGVIDVAGDGEEVRAGRLVLRPGATAPTDPVLVDAAATVGEYVGKKPDRALRALGKGMRERAVDDLVAAGVLAEEKHRALGIFPTTRHPARSTAYEDELRGRLTAVLTGADAADARTGPVIALLDAAGVLLKVVPVEDKRQAKAIVKKVADGDWAAASVRRAVQAVQIATMVAVNAAVTSAATSAATN